MAQLLCGDAADVLKQLPSASVQTCITSPPYYRLRDYGVAGQIGLEHTPEEYVSRLIDVFAEVYRVLRPDGTLWLIIGDSYNASGTCGNVQGKQANNKGSHAKPGTHLRHLKPKDLIGIPWLVAFALRDSGWYLRSDCIWHKPNAFVESVKDRPTRCHEYVFLFAKSERYYYDAYAVRERALSAHRSGNGFKRDSRLSFDGRGSDQEWLPSRWRNRRTVWSINIARSEHHHAVFPEELVEICILAGTPPYACPRCLAPWQRQVKRVVYLDGRPVDPQAMREALGSLKDRAGISRAQGLGHRRIWVDYECEGWEPGCDCTGNDGSARSVVLDPFCGTGTTLAVAERLGRNAIGIDLHPGFIQAARERLAMVQPMLHLMWRGGRAFGVAGKPRSL